MDKIAKPIRVVLTDKNWVRGDRRDLYGHSMLLNHRGRMCCLGVAAKACGFLDKELINIGTPGGMIAWDLGFLKPEQLRYLEKWTVIRGDGESDTAKAVCINDDPDLDDKERVELLRPLFRRNGFQLVWRG